METPAPRFQLSCTQCGGELHPDEGQIFLTCPYCSASVFLDKSRVVFHWSIFPTLDENKARAALARWMSGSQTVKDLDKKSQVSEASFEYFPLWYFKCKAGNREEILLEPAAATSISELRQLNLPAGDLRKYDSGLDAQSHPPNIPLQAALDWIAQRQPGQQEIVEQALVHIPLYTFKYIFQGRTYTAIVEAASGGVFANIYPSKAEAPYQIVGGLSAAIFLCMALSAALAILSGGNNFSWIILGICVIVGPIAALILFALATWVAGKI